MDYSKNLIIPMYIVLGRHSPRKFFPNLRIAVYRDNRRDYPLRSDLFVGDLPYNNILRTSEYDFRIKKLK